MMHKKKSHSSRLNEWLLSSNKKLDLKVDDQPSEVCSNYTIN